MSLEKHVSFQAIIHLLCFFSEKLKKLFSQRATKETEHESIAAISVDSERAQSVSELQFYLRFLQFHCIKIIISKHIKQI